MNQKGRYKILGDMATWFRVIVIIAACFLFVTGVVKAVALYDADYWLGLEFILERMAIIAILLVVEEAVVQVLRHFMRMEMLAIYGPTALTPMAPYAAPYGQTPPTIPPMGQGQSRPGSPPTPASNHGQLDQGAVRR